MQQRVRRLMRMRSTSLLFSAVIQLSFFFFPSSHSLWHSGVGTDFQVVLRHIRDYWPINYETYFCALSIGIAIVLYKRVNYLSYSRPRGPPGGLGQSKVCF